MRGVLFSTVAAAAMLGALDHATAQTADPAQPAPGTLPAQPGQSTPPSQTINPGETTPTPQADAAAPNAPTGQAVDATQAGPAEQGGLQDIVVTAQRRAENAQRAPVVVTAIGADALKKQNVTDFAGLSALLPNTQVTIAGGARVTIAVRGIRNNDFSPGAESPVAVHIDGSYIPRQTGLTGQFYDIARVESLPGPQGTLYGRNAAAGAINIITNRPVDKLAGAAEIETGSYSEFRGFGMLNVPIAEGLAVRAAFQRFQHDPYNKAGGDDANQTSGRFSAQYTTGRLKLFGTFDYTKILGDGTIDNDLNNPPYDSRSIYSPLSRKLDGVNIRQTGIMGQADLDLDFATLTVQLSNRRSTENSYTRGGAQLSYFQFLSRAKIGEVRLSSNGSGKFIWVLGAFGFDEKQPSFGVVNADQNNPFGLNGTCDANNATPAPTCGNYLPQLNLRTRSYAFFGQTTWSPLMGLHITGGLRYSHDRKDYDGAYLCQIGGTGTGFDYSKCAAAPISLGTGSPFQKGVFNYKGGIAYDLSPRSIVYANTSTGYRAGGSFISPFYPTYGPERITAYEIGSKNQFFNRRLTVNVDAYRQNYKNYIFTYGVTGDIVPGPFFFPFSATQADNLGKVKITGADLTLAYLATPNDLVNFGVEYIHTRIGAGALRCGRPPAVNDGPCVTNSFTDPTGKALPNTPPWRVTGSYEHTFELANGATIVPRILTVYESGRYMDLSQLTPTRQGAFTKTDASLTYTSDGKHWNLSAFVQNLENHAIFQTAGPYSGSLPTLFPSGFTAIYRPPRIWGIRAGANF